MRRALVCEDDSSIRALVRTILTREGFSVDEAENGVIGLEKITATTYDLVVLDLMMPQMSGYEIVQQISDRPGQLKCVVVMTAVASAKLSEFAQPICTIVTKPFDVDRFAAVIRDCASACAQ